MVCRAMQSCASSYLVVVSSRKIAKVHIFHQKVCMFSFLQAPRAPILVVKAKVQEIWTVKNITNSLYPAF